MPENVIHLLNGALIERILKDMQLQYVQRRDGALLVLVEHEKSHVHAVLTLSGTRNATFKILCPIDPIIPKEQWPEILLLCNDFHAVTRCGRAFIDLKYPEIERNVSFATLYYEAQLQLEHGTTEDFLKTFLTNCFKAIERLLFEYNQRDESVKKMLPGVYPRPVIIEPFYITMIYHLAKGLTLENRTIEVVRKYDALDSPFTMRVSGIEWLRDPLTAHVELRGENLCELHISVSASLTIPLSKWPDALLACNKLNKDTAVGRLTLNYEDDDSNATFVHNSVMKFDEELTYRFVTHFIKGAIDEACNSFSKIHTDYMLL